MILNISGRTDIVAFYSEWLFNRFKEGIVDVRNPFYPKQVSRINLEDVDGIIFCTKNPIPILNKLDKIPKPYLFHITLTPYHQDIEPNVPNKKDIIMAIKKLSKEIGKDKVYIRYDPIFLSHKYTVDYHIKAFNHLCTLLKGSTTHIIISFIDNYKNVKKNINVLDIIPLKEEDYAKIGKSFSRIAKNNNMTVQTCAESHNLTQYGFIKSDCLTPTLAWQLTGKANFTKWTSRHQKECNCVAMIDIGAYNTCSHLCKYCYANYDESCISNNIKEHDPTSSLLIGYLKPNDIIKVRWR